jgi:hypothetical protein
MPHLLCFNWWLTHDPKASRFVMHYVEGFSPRGNSWNGVHYMPVTPRHVLIFGEIPWRDICKFISILNHIKKPWRKLQRITKIKFLIVFSLKLRCSFDEASDTTHIIVWSIRDTMPLWCMSPVAGNYASLSVRCVSAYADFDWFRYVDRRITGFSYAWQYILFIIWM